MSGMVDKDERDGGLTDLDGWMVELFDKVFEEVTQYMGLII